MCHSSKFWPDTFIKQIHRPYRNLKDTQLVRIYYGSLGSFTYTLIKNTTYVRCCHRYCLHQDYYLQLSCRRIHLVSCQFVVAEDKLVGATIRVCPHLCCLAQEEGFQIEIFKKFYKVIQVGDCPFFFFSYPWQRRYLVRGGRRGPQICENAWITPITINPHYHGTWITMLLLDLAKTYPTRSHPKILGFENDLLDPNPKTPQISGQT